MPRQWAAVARVGGDPLTGLTEAKAGWRCRKNVLTRRESPPLGRGPREMCQKRRANPQRIAQGRQRPLRPGIRASSVEHRRTRSLTRALERRAHQSVRVPCTQRRCARIAWLRAVGLLALSRSGTRSTSLADRCRYSAGQTRPNSFVKDRFVHLSRCSFPEIKTIVNLWSLLHVFACLFFYLASFVFWFAYANVVTSFQWRF